MGACDRNDSACTDWLEVKEQWDSLSAVIAVFANMYPAIYRLLEEGEEEKLATLAAGGRVNAWLVVVNALLRARGNNEKEMSMIIEGDIDDRLFTEIHNRFFQGTTEASSGIDWSQCAPNWAAKDVLSDYATAEAAIQVAFIAGGIFVSLIPVAGPFLAAALGLIEAARSYEHYRDMAILADATIADELLLVDPTAEQAARVRFIVDLAFAFIDVATVAAKGIKTGKTIQVDKVPSTTGRIKTGKTIQGVDVPPEVGRVIGTPIDDLIAAPEGYILSRSKYGNKYLSRIRIIEGKPRLQCDKGGIIQLYPARAEITEETMLKTTSLLGKLMKRFAKEAGKAGVKEALGEFVEDVILTEGIMGSPEGIAQEGDSVLLYNEEKTAGTTTTRVLVRVPVNDEVWMLGQEVVEGHKTRSTTTSLSIVTEEGYVVQEKTALEVEYELPDNWEDVQGLIGKPVSNIFVSHALHVLHYERFDFGGRLFIRWVGDPGVRYTRLRIDEEGRVQMGRVIER
jgi:hypothetical protein